MATKVILDNGIVLNVDIQLKDIIEMLTETDDLDDRFLLLDKYLVPLTRVVYFEGDRNEL